MSRHPIHRWRHAVAVPALLALCAGCGGVAPVPGPGGAADAGQAVGVALATAATEPLALEVEAVGTAMARESVEVTSRWANTVTAVRFVEGQRVRRGTVLVEFDSAQVRADLAAAEAALAESRSQFNRSRELFATRALSQAQLDQIEATHLANQARVAAAQARLADTMIRAPFDGQTGLRRVSVGAFVSPGTVITTLDDTSIIKLDFTVPQAFAFALRPGLAVSARPAGLAEREFQGRITTLDSRVDPVTRAIAVRAELPNADGLLKPGMYMMVVLRGDTAPALLVPEAALVPERGVDYVFVVSGGRATKRKVTIGRRRPGKIEITAGLGAGERVIVEGTQKVRDGTAVREVAAVAAG